MRKNWIANNYLTDKANNKQQKVNLGIEHSRQYLGIAGIWNIETKQTSYQTKRSIVGGTLVTWFSTFPSSSPPSLYSPHDFYLYPLTAVSAPTALPFYPLLSFLLTVAFYCQSHTVYHFVHPTFVIGHESVGRFMEQNGTRFVGLWGIGAEPRCFAA